MTQINRWFVRAASVSAVLVLCSCASTSTPDNSSIQNKSASQGQEARVAADDAAIKSAEDEEAGFEEVARNYRASAVKPQLPEAAHRFAVQAEDAINAKDFNGASDLYRQALEVAPWWPEGHYNRAIVLSETPVAASARPAYGANEADCHAVMNELNSGKQTEDIATDLNISRASVRHCRAQARAARSVARAAGESPMESGKEPSVAPSSAMATADFKGAILEMKRYLLLVPNAPNARAAQDMIYKWERRASAAN